MNKGGTVYLVGAGPGDPGLCTVRGLELIRKADVIVYDYLVDDRLLSYTRSDVELVYVGKQAGRHTMRQEEINRLLVELAAGGREVVRLKGGDPFVFGRGGEEALSLSDAGVSFEVVPGVTSGIAAPAYAGIPLTHRGISTSGLLVTGHESPEEKREDLDWIGLAPTDSTLVFYMGVRNIDRIARRLIEAGRDRTTPAALIRWGTTPAQRTLTARLDEIADRAACELFEPPALLIVGKVVELRKRLRWFDNRPLFGKRVVVTRSRSQRSELSALLASRGAEVIEFPTIEMRPPDSYARLDEALRRVGEYDWLLLTSQNTVAALFDRLDALGLDARCFTGVRFAVVGCATASALRERGIRADLEPRRHTAEGLLETFDSRRIPTAGARVLFPCSSLSAPILADGLAERGAVVDRIVAYVTVPPHASPEAILSTLDSTPDLVTFASSSAVTNFVSLLTRCGKDGMGAGRRAASIGPVTTQTARASGIDVVVEAADARIPALVESIEDYFSKRR